MAITTISKELREAFENIVNTGDEAQARKFIIDHLKEFPEKMQDSLTVAFLEEALAKKNAEDNFLLEFQKEGVSTLDTLEKAKQDLEKSSKLAEIKENI